MANTQFKLKWASVLAISTLVLILRVVDFIYETLSQDFRITRIGLDIMGTNALIIQLAIIFTSFVFFWIASEKLLTFKLATQVK